MENQLKKPMKQLAILSVGQAEDGELSRLEVLPEFRKATLNMKLATLAFDQALASLSHLSEDFKKELGLFLGTGHGEFTATLDFLKGWAQQKFPRPFLFQNSLHNSTTGFVGLGHGLHAAACTTSHHYFSGEDALDLAQQFILTGNIEVAAVIGVDARAGGNLPLLEEAGFPHAQWGQGAGCIILASLDYCQKKNLKPISFFTGIEITPCLDRPMYHVDSGFDLGSFYDSHAVEALAKAVSLREFGRSGEPSLHLQKPNGSHSKIFWSKTNV